MASMNRITPSNYPPTGVVSYSQGSPLIVFNIGSKNAMMMGRTIRLNGKIKYTTSAGGKIGNNGVLLSNLGVYAALEQLSISSNQSGVNIETIRSYNRYLTSGFKSTRGLQKMANSSTIENVCSPAIYTGTNILDAEDSLGAANELPFSCELPCGLFSGDVPLSMDTTGGITLSIQLSPDSNMFYGITTVGQTNANGCLYSLSDVHLTYEDRLMTDMEMKMNSMSYNSIQTFYQVVSNNTTSINLNLGLSKVLSVFMNFLNQEAVNNYNLNGFETGIFIDEDNEEDNLKRIQFLKGGVKYPIEFNIDTFNDVNAQLSTQIAREFKQCFTNNINTLADCYRSQVNTPNNNDLDPVDVEWNFGVGVNYDQISNLGANFSQDQWGIIIDKLSTNPAPYVAYIFVKSVNELNFSNNGLSINL